MGHEIRKPARSHRWAGRGTAVAFLMVAFGGGGLAQDEPEKRFFQVTLKADNGYTYDKLIYKGDSFEFQAKAGTLLTGTTEKGVTVVIILGEVELRITPAAEEHQAAFREAFGAAQTVLPAKKAYLRLSPEEYQTLIQGAVLTPRSDAGAFKAAKALYDEKFNGSYHAGPLATIPPAKTFFCDLEPEKIGQVVFEEGDFLRLVRIAPYKSVYPSRYPNPKRR